MKTYTIKKTLKGDAILAVTAIIWGFAFVAQRVGMEHVEAFVFNAVRFGLGSISLVPVILLTSDAKSFKDKTSILGGILAGIVLFVAASFQQIGIIYTTAGNAGFITGLYVVIVPMMGLFVKERIEIQTWIGAIIAAIGLYFLSITNEFSINFGDFLVLLCAFCFAIHMHVIGNFSPKTNPVVLSFYQFLTCSLLSLIPMMLFESPQKNDLTQAVIPILYAGICSVGVAYTLQTIGQRYANPTHAAIILCMEGVFAAVGGWIILNEVMSARALLGCVIMLSGTIISQIPISSWKKTRIYQTVYKD